MLIEAASLIQYGIEQSGLAMVNVSYYRYIANLVNIVHEP
jgi:hypothetical protein